MEGVKVVSSINTPANQYEIYDNGFGDLVYQGTQLARVSGFKDSGQQPLGNPIILYTISSKVPSTIISPQALQAGKLEMRVCAPRNEGLWGSIMDDLLRGIQSKQEAFQMEWVDLDGEGNPVNELVYYGVTIVNAQREINVDASSGANTSTYLVNAMYTSNVEKTLS